MHDPETGLYLLGHRYYDPATGRFLNRDPIGTDGGENLYNAFGGNPVNEIDPEGTNPIDDAGHAIWKWLTNCTKFNGNVPTLGQGGGAQGALSPEEEDEGGVEPLVSSPKESANRLNNGIRDSLGWGASNGLGIIPISGGVSRWEQFLNENEGVLGAHVKGMHVAWCETRMRIRLIREGKDAITSFDDLPTASRIVGDTIEANTAAIKAWLSSSKKGN